MSHFNVTTEVYEHTIPVVIFDEKSILSEEIQKGLAHYPTSISCLEVWSAKIDYVKMLESAYKIVCVIHPQQFSEEQITLLKELGPYQESVVLVIPIFSVFSQEIVGEIPRLEDAYYQQKSCIELCNTLLPRATCIFIKDMISKPGTGTILDYFFQSLQADFAFIPTATMTLVSKELAIDTVVRELLRPERTSSCIQGQKKSCEQAIKKIAFFYDQYHRHDTTFQVVKGQEAASIPFSVKTVVLKESFEDVCRTYSQELPAPSLLPFELLKSSVDLSQRHSSLPEEQQVDAVITHEELSDDFQQTVSGNEFEQTEQKAALLDSIPTEQQFDLQSELQKIFIPSRKEQKRERVAQVLTTVHTIEKKKKKRAALFYGGLVFTLAGVCAGVASCIFIVSSHLYTQVLEDYLSALLTDKPISQSLTKKVEFFSGIVSKQVDIYTTLFELPALDEAKHLLTLPAEAREVSLKKREKNERLLLLIKSILGKSASVSIHDEIAALEGLENPEKNYQFNSAVQVLTLSEEAQKSLKEKFSGAQDTSKQEEKTLQFVQTAAPSLFGESSEKVYAIILQNNQELRPTGGFMEAVALAHFKNGSLTDVPVYSSYEIDKKLPGEIPAPAEIAHYTGEKRLTFFETNWEPDLPTSAEKIRFYLQKSLGVSVDGVLTLDLYALQHILEVTGPLDVPEHNEVITSKNIFERMEAHSEVVLIPTAERREYRVLILEKILEKMRTLSDEKMIPLLSALLTNLSTRSQLFTTFDAETQAGLQNLGWTGSVISPPCPTEFQDPCLVDTFLNVETNVGVNKANASIHRTSTHRIELTGTTVVHTHLLELTNTALSGAWPKGPYKVFMRTYLPSSARSVQVAVDSSPLPATQIQIASAYGKKVVAFASEVPLASTKKISISYTIDAPLHDSSYVFALQKQAGLSQEAVAVTVSVHPSLSPQLITPITDVIEHVYTFPPQIKPVEVYGFQFHQAK